MLHEHLYSFKYLLIKTYGTIFFICFEIEGFQKEGVGILYYYRKISRIFLKT